jgi:transposase
MVAERTVTERANSKTIARWSAYLEELHVRIAPRFPRLEVGQRAYRYLTGLLADVRRKNSWQLVEAIGEATRDKHLLNDARWDTDEVRDEVDWEKLLPPKGFHVLPKRWVVERTFSWTDQNRRMSKDYERLTETSEASIYVAMSRLMARRLARP